MVGQQNISNKETKLIYFIHLAAIQPFVQNYMPISDFTSVSRIEMRPNKPECARSDIYDILSTYPQSFSNTQEPITICNEIIFRGINKMTEDIND